jgi:hypothetical protein
MVSSLPDPRNSNYDDSAKTFNPFASSSSSSSTSNYNYGGGSSRSNYQQHNQMQIPNTLFRNGSSSSAATGGDQLCTDNGGGATGGCKALGLDMKKISLELIRHDILRKLRMDENRLPNITAKDYLIPPAYLNELYLQNDMPSDEYLDDEHATTEKIIAFSRIRKLHF